MKKLALFMVGTVFAFTASAQSDEVSPALETAISELIDATGVLEIGEQFGEIIIAQMSETLRQEQPDLPEQAFEIIREEVNATISGELETGNFEAQIIPVYAKYFTFEEVLQLLAFYQTPLGRKTVEVMPLLSQESMQVGQAWGMGLGPIIGQRVSARLAAAGINIE